jgi:hypothetical protein
VTGVLGGSFMGGTVIAALMVADVPLGAALAAASFGALGVLGALVRLRRRWRCRGRGMRLPPPTGRGLGFTAGVAAGCGAWTVFMGFLGSLPGTVVYGTLAALLALWCAVSGRARGGWWTTQDGAILSGDLSMAAWERAGQAGGEAR